MDRKFIVGLIRVFIFGFLGVFIPAVAGVSDWSNYEALKAAILASIGGAIAAGVKAAADTLTKGVSPLPSKGILSRNVAP